MLAKSRKLSSTSTSNGERLLSLVGGGATSQIKSAIILMTMMIMLMTLPVLSLPSSTAYTTSTTLSPTPLYGGSGGVYPEMAAPVPIPLSPTYSLLTNRSGRKIAQTYHTSPHQHYQHPAMANGYSNSYTNSNEFLRRSQEQSEKQQQQLATQMMAALVAAAAPVSNNYPPLDVGSAGNSQDGQSQDSQSNYTGMYGGAGDYYQQQYLPAASYYQPYMGMDSSATGYMMPQPMMDQYSAAYYYGNHSGTKQGNGAKMNKNGLGRRFGELVSTGAERATRAFKSISQLKLFNEIKPSKLLGINSGDQSTSGASSSSSNSSQSTYPMSAYASSPSSTWYYPPSSMSQWPSSSNYGPATSPAQSSSLYYQQPVFVRTQDLMQNSGSMTPASTVGSLNNLLQTSSVSPAPMASALHSSGSKSQSNQNDFLNSLTEYYRNQKLPLDTASLYNSVLSSQSSPSNQYQSIGGSSSSNSVSSNPVLPIGTSTTTVFHHYGNNGNRENYNQQASAPMPTSASDLFTAPQTQYGHRVKAPKDYSDFDNSNDDMDMDSQNGGTGSMDQDNDSKMMDNSNNNNGDGGIRDDNRDRNNNIDDHRSNNDNEGPRGPSQNWNTYEDYAENSYDPDLYHYGNMPPTRYNRPSYGGGGVNSLNNPLHHHHNVQNRQPQHFNRLHHDVPQYPNHHQQHPVRRPVPIPDLEDSNDWYNTFLGPNAPSIPPRVRSMQFAAQPPFHAHAHPHHHHHPPSPVTPSSLLSSSGSTQMPMAMSPENKFMNQYLAAGHSFYQDVPATPQPTRHHPTYMPYGPMRPGWGMYGGHGGMQYPGFASVNPYQFNHQFRANPAMMSTAASAVRPVTINPYYQPPRFYPMQSPNSAAIAAASNRFRTPFYTGFGYPGNQMFMPQASNQMSGFGHHNPSMMAASNQYMKFASPPMSSMMTPASSSMYPMHVPFHGMQTFPGHHHSSMHPMGHSMMPMMGHHHHHPSMMRYRYGAEYPVNSAGPSRRMTITKRADFESPPSSSSSTSSQQEPTSTTPSTPTNSTINDKFDLLPVAYSLNSESDSPSQFTSGTKSSSQRQQSQRRNRFTISDKKNAIQTLTPSTSTTTSTPAPTLKLSQNFNDGNLATIYNAYQVLQKQKKITSESNKTGPIREYYHHDYYYIGKHSTTTSTSTAAPPMNTIQTPSTQSPTDVANSNNIDHISSRNHRSNNNNNDDDLSTSSSSSSGSSHSNYHRNKMMARSLRYHDDNSITSFSSRRLQPINHNKPQHQNASPSPPPSLPLPQPRLLRQQTPLSPQWKETMEKYSNRIDISSPRSSSLARTTISTTTTSTTTTSTTPSTTPTNPRHHSRYSFPTPSHDGTKWVPITKTNNGFSAISNSIGH